MIVERMLPRYDAVLRRHLVVAGAPDEAFRRVTEIDLAETASRDRVMRPLFAMRGAADRLARGLRGLPAQAEVASARLSDLPEEGEWVRLGEEGAEFAFGAIGRFWGGKVEFLSIHGQDFRDFDTPGVAKIAASLSVRPYGADRSLVSYEVRTAGTDEAARRGFLRYWRVVSPFVGWIMHRLLLALRDRAARGPSLADSAV